MKIMSVNSGSSSIKFQLFEMPAEKVIASGQVDKIGYADAGFKINFNGKTTSNTLPVDDHQQGVGLIIKALIDQQVIKDMKEVEGVGHRIVQGAEEFTKTTVITQEVLQTIKDLATLAPLHNLAHAVSIEAFLKAMPTAVHFAVFDTAFHQTMKQDTYLYAVPYHWYKDYAVRKYGFHGTSHKYVSQKANELLKIKDSKIIVCHIGNGASITAVRDGLCVDTSMGLTPLEGIPMGTRSGSLDPTIVSFMVNKLNVSADEVNNMLNKESGYLGISGVTSDARDLEAQIRAGHQRSKLAFELQAKRIADYIGSYFIAMEGLDAIVFTAGIGENSPCLRKMVCDRLKALEVQIDETKNNENATVISTKESKVKILTIKTNEELMIAREVLENIK